MSVLSIKVPIRKKSGNLFNDPRKPQQNNICWLCDKRDETIDYIISECCKLVKKEYKTRHDWVGKVTHWELCKKLKFNHTAK